MVAKFFVFIICLKQIFLRTAKFGAPVATGLPLGTTFYLFNYHGPQAEVWIYALRRVIPTHDKRANNREQSTKFIN